MSTVSLKNASLSGAVKYNSLLAGNVAFEPITGDYELLETTTLGTATASVTFSGLDTYTDYKHLQIRAIIRSDKAGGVSSTLTFNSDTSASYAFHTLFGQSSGVNSDAGTSRNDILPFLDIDNATSTANSYMAAITDILDFSDSSKNTTVRTFTGTTGRNQVRLNSGLYFKTDAITSMTFGLQTDNYVAGSRFSLYGIKGA